jgi:hypothetical protein
LDGVVDPAELEERFDAIGRPPADARLAPAEPCRLLVRFGEPLGCRREIRTAPRPA